MLLLLEAGILEVLVCFVAAKQPSPPGLYIKTIMGKSVQGARSAPSADKFLHVRSCFAQWGSAVKNWRLDNQKEVVTILDIVIGRILAATPNPHRPAPQLNHGFH